MDMSVIGVLGSYMDNKVVIKVRYNKLTFYMSWKAIIKFKCLGDGVWFDNLKDLAHYRRSLECLT